MGNKSFSIFIRKCVPYFFKLLYFYITGHLLLLISAIAENGKTALSCSLLPNRFEAEEMMESIVVAAVILLIGRIIFYFILISNDT